MRIDSLNLTRPNFMTTENGRAENINSFSDVLNKAVSDLNSLEAQNQQNNLMLATGKVDNLHNVMIDLERADIALQFTLQVRNRIMEAYNEIMRMQI